jgi:DNA polymerase-3 subunit gamma/tau
MAEKYQVLARRYRPQCFSDVVGQEAVLQTLKNAIARDLVAHAYLFSGSRGVGKTTLARLFAKALNCSALKSDGEPCNSCSSCIDISSGQSLDVIEIDGASNRGIDDIRQINETVGFAPSHGKYKITIIDEVHMLTKEAFNALLKTLEEPPEKAKFFFATTEPHKVLPTIISRCQRFDLGRILPLQIFNKLSSIATELQREVEPEALHLIAHFADGSLRDAESLFDQILCFSPLKITAADVRSSLGLVSQDLFFALDLAFSESRLSFAFELVEQLFQAGLDLSHFLDQLIEHYRNLTVCKTFKATSLTPDLAARYIESALLYTQPQCLSILDLLLKAQTQNSRSTTLKIALEMTLLQILRTKNRLPIEVLIRRLSDLEQSLHLPSIKQEPAAQDQVSEKPVRELPTFHPEKNSSISAPEQPPQEPSFPIVQDLEVPTSYPTSAESKTMPTLVELPITGKEEPLFKNNFDPVIKKIFEDTPAQDLTPIDKTPRFQTDILDRPAPPTQSVTPTAIIPVKIEITLPTAPTLANKHPSHYHTLMRFTAVELEGTFKN